MACQLVLRHLARRPSRHSYFLLLRASSFWTAVLGREVYDDDGSGPCWRPPAHRRPPWKTAAWGQGRPARARGYPVRKDRGHLDAAVSCPRCAVGSVSKTDTMVSRRRHEAKGRRHNVKVDGPYAGRPGAPRVAPDPSRSGGDGGGRGDAATWCGESVRETAHGARRVLYVAALD